MYERIAALALVSCLSVGPQDESKWGKLLEGTSFTLRESVERAVKESGPGVPFHAELEEDKGKLVYSIDVAQGEKTCNVVLDAKDGKVLEKDLEAEDHSPEVKAWKITLASAIDSALKKNPGKPVEAELTLADDKPVVTVKVFADAKVTSVRVDGVTGEVLAQAAPKAEPKADQGTPYTEIFRVEASEWSSTGANPYFILEPGYFLVLEGKDGEDDARLTVTVLDQTRQVDGVETRIVEEREEVGGELAEISRNYFAISKKTNSVYYFGEEVDIYEDGKIVKHEGAWEAGKNARFGLIMSGTPLIGARYYQEIAPGVAMDRAEIVGLSETLQTPAGKFENCLKTFESTPLEKAEEYKYYAPGIGLVREEDLKLTQYGRGKK